MSTLLLAGVALAALLLHAAYNLFRHPLRAFPGPVANRLSVLPLVYGLWRGDLPYRIASLHRQYGKVVRIAPNELAFCDHRAWEDVYLRGELSKDMNHYNALRIERPSIISSDGEEHDRLRKLLAPAFTKAALRKQEAVIEGQVSTLMNRLTEQATELRTVNMRDWFTYATFDMFGMLAFGEDFGCLRGDAFAPWVALVVGNVKQWAVVNGLSRLGLIQPVMFIMKALRLWDQKRKQHLDLTRDLVRKREDTIGKCYGLLDPLLTSGLDPEQIAENAAFLVIAGSETTATLLAGVTFLLATHPDVQQELRREVRGRFSSEDEIGFKSVESLTYLRAVLEEALRLYPPVPNAAPRRVGPGGANIAGCDVPHNAVVGVWQWALFHDPDLFPDPDSFHPMRWIDKSESGKVCHDWRDAVKPFLLGRGSCPGRNLAYAELRLVLARLIWRFDITVADSCKGWMRGQKSYILWDKPKLEVHLSLRGKNASDA